MSLASEIAEAGYTDYWFASRLRKALAEVQGGTCALCGRFLDDREVTIDHVWPRGKNGYCGPGNFVAVHKWCNHEKADAYPCGCEIIWLVATNAKMGFETRLIK